MKIVKIDKKDSFGREIYLVSVEKVDDLDVTNLSLNSRYFTLMIINNNHVNELYFEKCKHLILHGLAYMRAWGSECSLLDSLFDEASVMLEVDEGIKICRSDEDVIMTTWHENESLDSAIDYFLRKTEPTKMFNSECNSSIILQVGGDKEMANKILKMWSL